MNNIIANYGDVIPKQDYLNLQKQFEALQARVSERATEFDNLKLEHEWVCKTKYIPAAAG